MTHKIAVLVSGEYRKFDICRKTMKFLDDPNVDVYFSTWNKTVYSNPKINLHVVEEVTPDRILQDFGRPARILIDQSDKIVEKRYNSKMIDRWKSGFDMIKNSGIMYSHVVVMRPDIFYTAWPVPTFGDLEKYSKCYGFAWANSLHLKKLADVYFISSFDNIKSLFDRLSISSWEVAEEGDWHKWWYTFVESMSIDIVNTDTDGHFVFCRYWATPDDKVERILKIQHDWRDLKFLHQIDNWGINFAYTAWPKEIVDDALEKWKSGHYRQYMNRAIIFDLDGVIVSTDILHSESLTEAIQEVSGVTVSVDKKSMLSTKEKILGLVEKGLISPQKIEEIILEKDRIFNSSLHKLTVKENVISCLEQIKSENIKTAIASNSRLCNINAILDTTGLKKYFDIIVSAEEVPKRKPAPDILFETYKRLKVNGSNTLFVEDSDEGAEAGHQSLSTVVRVNSPADLSFELFREWINNVRK